MVQYVIGPNLQNIYNIYTREWITEDCLFFVGPKSPPIKALKWLKDGQLLTEEGRPKVQIFDTMLRVNNVQTEDGGVYQCFITLDSGLEIQSSGELRLGGEEEDLLLLLSYY